MRRILFDVPRWHVFLHREARCLPSVEKDDPPLRQLEDEFFDRLYSGELEKAKSPSPASLSTWAERLHETCGKLPAFERLSAECLGDADASGLAVETLMQALQPHLQRKPEEVPPSALRRALTAGCSTSSEAIAQQRELAEGLGGVGFGPGSQQLGVSSSASQRLAARLKNDERLRKIAQLAGRFRRIAAQKQRTRIRHGADEVSDVETGGDLARVLPSALVKLGRPALRKQLLLELSERKALQYRLQGAERLGRGPLVVCLDKSGSMHGAPDVWATAVALGLLEVAQRQRRPFAVLCFDERVKHEAVTRSGEPLPEQTLFVDCGGGTSISHVLRHALSLIEKHEGSLKKADVVLITDGESDTTDATSIRTRASELGVSLLGFGIGVDAVALAPWCDETHVVRNLDRLDESTAEALFTL